MKNNTHNCLINKKAKGLAFCFLLFTFCLKAQVNYVLNPSFEYVANCGDPYGSFIPEATPWDTLKNGGGGGYPMNRCFNPNQTSSVPANLSGGGYQVPRTGNGYVYVAYFKNSPNPAINWRWYITAEDGI